MINPKELLGKSTDSLSVSRVFGPPIEQDGCLIIPVAFAAGGGGVGVDNPQAGGDPALERVGGGFGGVTWPIGVYAVKDGNVRWVPVVNVTGLLLAVIAAITLVVTRTQPKR